MPARVKKSEASVRHRVERSGRAGVLAGTEFFSRGYRNGIIRRYVVERRGGKSETFRLTLGLAVGLLANCSVQQLSTARKMKDGTKIAQKRGIVLESGRETFSMFFRLYCCGKDNK